MDPSSFWYGDLVYRRAEPTDDAEIRAALRENEIKGWVRWTSEREPEFRDGENLMGPSSTYVAREESGAMVGTYAVSYFPVHVNGRPETAGYLSGLRVHPAYRHRARVLRGGFASLAHLDRGPKALPYYLTSLARDNAPARRLLEARLPGFPVYAPVGPLDTFVLPAMRRRPRGALRPARSSDIPDLAVLYNSHAARYQFAPFLSEEWLSRLDGEKGLRLSDFLILEAREEIQGFVALWDQRAFKQTRVTGYRFPLDHARPFINLWALLRGRGRLPRPGSILGHMFLAFLWVRREDPANARTLLAEALSVIAARGGEAGVCGVSPANPLFRHFRAQGSARALGTVLETVHWGDPGEARLDGRPPQPEAALL